MWSKWSAWGDSDSDSVLSPVFSRSAWGRRGGGWQVFCQRHPRPSDLKELIMSKSTVTLRQAWVSAYADAQESYNLWDWDNTNATEQQRSNALKAYEQQARRNLIESRFGFKSPARGEEILRQFGLQGKPSEDELVDEMTQRASAYGESLREYYAC